MAEIQILSCTIDPEDVIARAARQCYSTDCAYDIELSDEEKEKLIRKVVDNGHHSVLEHASITFAIHGISRACSHQLVRHRMASYSQQSQRYVNVLDANDDVVIPKSISDKPYLKDIFMSAMYEVGDAYRLLLQAGIPKEDARYVLPNAMTTDIVVTMNFRELIHFFELRLCKRSQWEIRELAKVMLRICEDVAPIVFRDITPPCSTCSNQKCCGDKQK